MKLLGLIAVIISFTACGMAQSSKLYKRVAQLLSLKKAMVEIKGLIKYQGRESSEIINYINKKYNGLLEEEWQSADRKIVENLLSGLGKTDTEGQLRFCDGILNYISTSLAEAEKDKNEKSKLYTTLGVCGGLAVAIIIF